MVNKTNVVPALKELTFSWKDIKKSITCIITTVISATQERTCYILYYDNIEQGSQTTAHGPIPTCILFLYGQKLGIAFTFFNG